MNKFFEDWFNNNEVGIYVKQQEIDFLNLVGKEVYGNYAIQMGLHIDSEFTNNVKNYIMIGKDIICDNEFLPFKSDILSGVFLIHELEFSTNPRFLLKELHRVLEPGGKLIIISLNPSIILSYLRIFNNKLVPKRKDIVHYTRLKEWLELLGFRIILGKFMVYVPINVNINNKYLNKLKFLEIIGNRWWPHFSCIYGLVATKNSYLLNPLLDLNIKNSKKFNVRSVLHPVKINSNINKN